MARKTFIGWARGVTPLGDETGLWHAVVFEEGREQVRAACAPNVRVSGQLEQKPESAHVCQRIGCSQYWLSVRPS